MLHRLTLALKARRVAENRVVTTLRELYPLESPIRWMHGTQNGICEGHVVMHCCYDRIKVHNERTGKDVFIYAYCIV